MKQFVIHRWTCIPVCLSMALSCSTVKHRNNEHIHHLHATTTISSQHDSLQYRQLLQRVYLLKGRQGEVTEISPTGPFTLDADAGFSGQANRVVTYRYTEAMYAGGENQATDSTHTHQRHLQQTNLQTTEKESKAVSRTGGSGSGWRWALAVLLALAAVIWYRVRRK
jgi:hypothetical protein